MGKVMGEKRRPGHQIGNEPADQPEPEVKQRKQKRKSSSAVSAADATTVSVPPPLRRSKRQRSVRVGKGATRTQNSNTNDDNGDDRVISSEKAHDEGSCITSTGSESTAMKKTRLDAVAARTCPHCQREFSTKQSRNVHILSFICRPKESSDAANGDIPVPTRKRKKAPYGSKQPSKKRSRGSLEDRTCPNCQRVFTSVMGCTYHREKRVCIIAANNKEGGCAFWTLKPGEKFVTPYGVVEVMDDSRARPTGFLPPDLMNVMKRWGSARAKRDSQFFHYFASVASQSRARRILLQELHQQGRMTQSNVFQVYFRSDNLYNFSGRTKNVHGFHDSLRPDPSLPMESFPDRMVTCRLIPDQRKRIYTDDYDERDRDHVSNVSNSARHTLLFLRRSLLKEEYLENVPVYKCKDCGGEFSSSTGYKYHAVNAVCRQKKRKEFENEDGRRATIARRAEVLLQKYRAQQHHQQQQQQSLVRPKEPHQVQTNKSAERFGILQIHQPMTTLSKKARKDPSLYPQVLISLGYKLLPKVEKPRVVSAFGPRKKRPPASKDEKKVDNTVDPQHSDGGGESRPPLNGCSEPFNDEVHVKTESVSCPSVIIPPLEKEDGIVDPRDTLLKLRWQLKFEQSKFMGPIYPTVYRALRFKKWSPREAKKPSERPKRMEVKRTRKVMKYPSLPPLVDPMALVGEIEAGRYPSIKPLPNDYPRDKNCFICKTIKVSEELHQCTYCPRVFHWKCSCTQFTTKMPEPEDKVLCAKCIRVIQSRRVRAEKRQREKYSDNPLLLEVEEKKAAADAVTLATRLVSGREYECVAAQGVRVNDLAELLRDAQLRLSNCMEISRINAVRRGYLEELESNVLL